MAVAPSGAPTVPNPHIESCVSQDESQRLVWLIEHPAVSSLCTDRHVSRLQATYKTWQENFKVLTIKSEPEAAHVAERPAVLEWQHLLNLHGHEGFAEAQARTHPLLEPVQ